jgi:beta-alanine--pyruvate transaminase
VGARAYDVFVRCYEAGVLVRQTGDTIALSPPLIINEKQIEQMVGTLADAIRVTK